MKKGKPTYKELERRLAAAEPIVEALRHHEVDAVVGQEKLAILLLREVQEALLASDAGFRAMFDLPAIGMIQASTPDFRITRVNGKFCEMTGFSAAELLTMTPIGLTHPADRRRSMKMLAKVLRGKADQWSIENRLIRKDGTVMWVQIHGAALRDERGRAVKILAMISDITGRTSLATKRKRIQRTEATP